MTVNPSAVITADLDPNALFDRIRNLRLVSVVEAVSYLMLLVATVVKRAGGSELGVEVLGPIHGLLFLAYALLVVLNAKTLGWGGLKVVGAWILGSLPFGGFWVERRWLPRRSA